MPDDWIRQWGDPTLHEAALPVRRVDDLLRHQIERMRQRLVEAGGAGLAATQVGLLQRVFVYRASPDDPVEAIVNPRLVSLSAERATFLEGCLSFNDVVVSVERPAAVRLEAQTLDGRSRTFDVEGFEASLFQHETDHLDGILTLDRATPAERRRAVAELLARRREAA